MRTMDVLLTISLCGFWGCASSKPFDAAGAGSQPVVDQNEDEKPAVKQNHQPQRVVAQTSPDENRSVSKAATDEIPKVKANDSDVVPRSKPVAVKESPKVETKDDNLDHKPAEMKVAKELDRNPYLTSIVKPLLPLRTSVTDAATGFKNQRQFIAAAHLSRNLNIPFDQIKTRMTAEHRMSLNDSLREIRPDMTKNLAKAEANKAEEQAKDDENLAKEQAKKAAVQAKLASSRKS